MENILEKVKRISDCVDIENSSVNVTHHLLDDVVALASAYDHWLYGEVGRLLSGVANYKTRFLYVSSTEVYLEYDTNKEAVNEKEHLLLCLCYKQIKNVEVTTGYSNYGQSDGSVVKTQDSVKNMVIHFSDLPDDLRQQLVDTLLKTEV